MGACVSIHHKPSSMKAQKSFDSTNKSDHKVVIHPLPTDDKFPVMSGHVAVKPQLPPSQSPATFSDFGSKEETFFDSQAWLDSDYEDDFVSVNGDFTPSRSDTPVRHSLTLETKQSQACTVTEPVGSMHESSPAPLVKKMKLLDFFKESVRENDHIFKDETTEPPQKDGFKSKSERPVGSLHGCFSNLLYVRGSGRQRKKSLISSVSVGRSQVVG